MYKKFLNRQSELSKKKSSTDLFSEFSKSYQNIIYSILGSPDCFKQTKLLFSAAVDARPRDNGKIDFYMLTEKAFKIKPIQDSIGLGACRYLMDSIITTVNLM